MKTLHKLRTLKHKTHIHNLKCAYTQKINQLSPCNTTNNTHLSINILPYKNKQTKKISIDYNNNLTLINNNIHNKLNEEAALLITNNKYDDASKIYLYLYNNKYNASNITEWILNHSTDYNACLTLYNENKNTISDKVHITFLIKLISSLNKFNIIIKPHTYTNILNKINYLIKKDEMLCKDIDLFSLYYYIYFNNDIFKYVNIFCNSVKTLYDRSNVQLQILVLQCENRNDDFLNILMNENKQICKVNNIKYLYIKECNNNKPYYWDKIFEIQKIMNTMNNIEYIYWLDSDVVLLNFNKSKLINLLNTYNTFTMLITPDQPKWNSVFNAGAFIIKNNDKGKEIVNEWATYYNPNVWTYNSGNKTWTTNSVWAGVDYEKGSFIKNILNNEKYKDHIKTISYKILNNNTCIINDDIINDNIDNTISYHFAGDDKYNITIQNQVKAKIKYNLTNTKLNNLGIYMLNPTSSPAFNIIIESFSILSSYTNIILYCDCNINDIPIIYNNFITTNNIKIEYIKDKPDDYVSNLMLENSHILLIFIYGFFTRRNVVCAHPALKIIHYLDSPNIYNLALYDYNLIDKYVYKILKSKYANIDNEFNFILLDVPYIDVPYTTTSHVLQIDDTFKYTTPIYKHDTLNIGLILNQCKLCYNLVYIINKIFKLNQYVILNVYSFCDKEWFLNHFNKYKHRINIDNYHNKNYILTLEKNLIYIDTIQYNMHSTATEVLNSKRPFISYKNNNSFFGSISSIFINHINMTNDLIADNNNDYIKLLLKHIKTEQSYNSLYNKFIHNLDNSQLLNKNVFTKNLYEKLNEIYMKSI